MRAIFESIGGVVLTSLKSISDAIAFAILCIVAIFNPKTYNPATVMVLVKQIYFTTIGLLPLFIIMAILFGSIFVGALISTALSFGLEQRIGSIVVTFVVDEFAAFFTALLIALRSGAAVNSEIALMSVNHELKTLEAYNIDIIEYLFVPRIISGMISLVALSTLFSIIMLISGYFYSFFLLNMDYNTYFTLLFNSLEIKNFLFLIIKSIIYGFFIMLIPIYSALGAKESHFQVPISVLRGMVRLFIVIFLVEVVSLILQLL